MRRFLSIPLGLLLILVLGSPTIALQPIDDFDVGPFTFAAVNGSQEHEVFIEAFQSHAIHWLRKVILEPSGGFVSATTEPGASSLDQVVRVTISGNGRFVIEWDWGYPADLTQGGSVDRVELELLAAATGAELQFVITNGSYSTAWPRVTAGGAETILWNYSELNGGGVSLTAVTGISLVFKSAVTPYLAADFRFRQQGSEAVDLVERFVATQIPPLPSPPLGFDVWDLFGQPLYSTDIIITEADAGFLPDMSAQWEQWPALGGQIGAATFQWDLASAFQDTQFELQIDFAPANGLLPEAYPPDPVAEARGFLLEFPVRMSDGGQVIGSSMARLQFDIAAGQGLEFQDVLVAPGPRGGREWSDGFPLSFRLAQVGAVDGALPLFHATWLADWNTQLPTGLPEEPFSATTELRLSALPSVTAGSTLLQASRPFEPGATLSLYDIRGRRLGSLPVRPGAINARWDGRDGAGRPTPAGLYFLRLSNELEGDEATARVLRIR